MAELVSTDSVARLGAGPGPVLPEGVVRPRCRAAADRAVAAVREAQQGARPAGVQLYPRDRRCEDRFAVVAFDVHQGPWEDLPKCFGSEHSICHGVPPL